jgi:hypothetical protein
MGTPYLSVRPGHPDFLDLDWSIPIEEWSAGRTVELPTGVHRHPVRFVAYNQDIYAIKELPLRLARHEYEMLRRLQIRAAPTATPVGIVERRWLDPHTEGAGVIITKYVEYAFPYRELVEGGGFGARRTQMLDAFAGLLVELHLAGCFWGDCSLSNVLYRYDAGAIEAVMIDAETVRLHEQLTVGQRSEDLDIMELNVAGGMADIAASQGVDIDDADLALGADITARYGGLWAELTEDIVIGAQDHYRIQERLDRLNDLGFTVDDVELVPQEDGGRLRMHVTVAGRNYHSNRLRELTRIVASEQQAKWILGDLRYYEAKMAYTTPSLKAVAAIQWRVSIFEPMLARLAAAQPEGSDPVQGFCDLLHLRYMLSQQAGHDIGNDEAFDAWVAAGRPGYPLDE